MSKEKELPKICEHCGAGMKSYFHSLTPGLVSILVLAIKHVKASGKNKFHYMHDLNLTHTQAANIQKLRFHALIAHYDPENSRNGEWLITKRGGQFLRGEISVPHKVQTFRNEVISHSKELIHISALKNKLPHFEQEFAYEVMPSKTESVEKSLFE